MTGPQEIAGRAAAMERADEALRSAGVRLVDVGLGWARTAMTVGAQHRGGHGLCHGGYLFLLADAAHAYACNSHGPTVVAAARTSSSCTRAGRATSSWPRRRNGPGRAGRGCTTSRSARAG